MASSLLRGRLSLLHGGRQPIVSLGTAASKAQLIERGRRNISSAFSTVSPSLREQYREEGYVIIPNLLDKDQVSTLLDEMEAICRGQRGEIPGVLPSNKGETRDEVLSRYLCIHFPHKVSSVIRDLVREEKTKEILRQLVSDDVKCMQTMMFMKGAGKPGQATHQDEFYIQTRDRSLCASWIALDDATIENGCLYIIPCSHRPGIIWPMKPHSDDRFDASGISYGHNYGEDDYQPVELASGSAVFFNGYLLHRSLPNRSAGFRRAFANHYMSAASLLPWTNDGRLDVKDDMRDILMVCGEDPYAKFRPLHDLTKPFVRAAKAQAGAVFNEVTL